MEGTTRLSIFVLAFLAAAGCRTAGIDRFESTAIVRSVPPFERLHVASFSLARLYPIYAAESQRLDRVCPPLELGEDTCRSRNVSSQPHRVATLHSRPDTSSPPAAFINARLYFRPEYGILVALDLEFADRPGEYVSWIPDTGAWDYSIHVDGRVRLEGDWIQFIDPLIRVPAWIPKEPADPTADLYPYVNSIAGEILHMEALEATNPSGTDEIIGPGDFIVTRVSPDVVEFRLEVESDFACGDDVPLPPVMPPLLRASPGQFFNPDGTPRFTTEYTKGC